MTAIPLRADFDARLLRLIAKKAKDGPQARRLLAVAAMSVEAQHPIADHLQRHSADLGRFAAQCPVIGAHRAALAAMVESGPIPAIHGVVRWRIIDLCQRLFEEHQVTVSKQTLSRELRALGYRKLSARPRHHAQRPGAIEHFKTYGPPRLQAVCSVRREQSALTYPALG